MYLFSTYLLHKLIVYFQYISNAHSLEYIHLQENFRKEFANRVPCLRCIKPSDSDRNRKTVHIPLNTFQIVDVNGMKDEGSEDFDNPHEGKCWFLILFNTSQCYF